MEGENKMITKLVTLDPVEVKRKARLAFFTAVEHISSQKLTCDWFDDEVIEGLSFETIQGFEDEIESLKLKFAKGEII